VQCLVVILVDICVIGGGRGASELSWYLSSADRRNDEVKHQGIRRGFKLIEWAGSTASQAGFEGVVGHVPPFAWWNDVIALTICI
jgi:hypothetical protein